MLDWFFQIHWWVFFQIIMIDVLLGGDNAIVIAMACKNLPTDQRKKGVFLGTLAAIVLRVILIIFTLQILSIPLLKVMGGLLLIWIGIKLLTDQEEEVDIKASSSVWGAVKTIAIADFVMSLDNVIGLAGVSEAVAPEHQIFYVIFGLLLSIPIIVLGSHAILKALDRFPIIIYFGAGLLGWIAVGMMMTDPWVVKHLLGGEMMAQGVIYYLLHLIGALTTVCVGFFLMKRTPSS